MNAKLRCFLAITLIAALPRAVLIAEELHPVAKLSAERLADPDATFVMIVEFKVHPDSGPAFLEAFKEPRIETAKESGNLAYELSRHPSDPSRYLLYEKWVNVAALDSHLKQPYLVKLGEAFGDLLAEPPKLSHYHPVEAP